MSKREQDPGRRENPPTTTTVAELLTAITLPTIEPFGPDSAQLTALPAYTPFPDPTNPSPSRSSIAREVYDDAVTALAALKRLEDATTACRAALIARLMGAASVDDTALALDRWQHHISEQSAHTEIATTLCIPEGTAATLAHHATTLITHHRATTAALTAGELSWRHACTLLDECDTLAETPGITHDELTRFESQLLTLAPHTTASTFRSKARRLREGSHPESMPARTKAAILARSITLEPGRDTMSWLTLHLPATAAQGIWVHCTRLARTLTGPTEHRTLTQRRTDIATTLLLGQHTLPTTCSPHCTTPNPTAGNPAPHPEATTPTTRTNNPQTTTPSTTNDPAPWDLPTTDTTSTADTADITGTAGHTGSGGGGLPDADTTDTTGTTGHTGSSGGGLPDADTTDITGTSGSGSPHPPHPPGPCVAGYHDGLVDGIAEDPPGDYLRMLDATRHGTTITDPPQPTAQILLTVPAISLLGTTNQPAELASHGPIPITLARTLLANTPTFLRVLTDPITNNPLPLTPQRYWIKDAERAVLRALANNCYFPNCTNPVLDTELDHITAWEHGGRSTTSNLRPACARHHTLKHFKDDKDAHGHHRQDHEPDRTTIQLRGWTPHTTPNGTLSWRSPAGQEHPATTHTPTPPTYPTHLRDHITHLTTPNTPNTPNTPTTLDYILITHPTTYSKTPPTTPPAP